MNEKRAMQLEEAIRAIDNVMYRHGYEVRFENAADGAKVILEKTDTYAEFERLTLILALIDAGEWAHEEWSRA